MEPISAMEVLTQMNPIQHIRYIQINPAVPPSMRPIDVVLSRSVSDCFWGSSVDGVVQFEGRGATGRFSDRVDALRIYEATNPSISGTHPNIVSQLDINIIENPKIDTKRKFLYTKSDRHLPSRLCCNVTYPHLLDLSHPPHCLPIGSSSLLLHHLGSIVDGSIKLRIVVVSFNDR